MSMNRVYKAVLILAIVVAFAPMASAGLVLMNDLPISNLNTLADGSNVPNRSNVDLSFGTATSYYSGDSAILPSTSSLWQIDKIIIWSTGRYSEGTTAQNFGTEYTSITLMGGAVGSDLSVLASGTYTSGAMDPTPGVGTIHTTQTSYQGGVDYVGLYGIHHPVMMTSFENLNFVVPSGEFAFGVYTGARSTSIADPLYGSWRNLLSNNGPLYGNQPNTNAADGHIYYFSTLFTQGAPFFIPANYWDSTTALDVNFEIYATAIPEPATYTMVGLGLLGAVFALRRRR